MSTEKRALFIALPIYVGILSALGAIITCIYLWPMVALYLLVWAVIGALGLTVVGMPFMWLWCVIEDKIDTRDCASKGGTLKWESYPHRKVRCYDEKGAVIE